MLDIQLAAGHWNQSGTWVSDNGHDHLGQRWVGNNNLTVEGTFGFPAFAPLVLTNRGVGDGLWITEAGKSGVLVGPTGNDGVFVSRAGAPGDVVAASGVADPLAGSTVPLATVQLADAESHRGIVGVVARRMALVPTPWYEGEPDEAPMSELRIADGAAQPGNYVALTVLGVAMVKVEAGAAIQPGQRLVASAATGRARALRTVEVDGVRLAEDAPAIGVALATPAPGEDAIPVFVTLR